jgi:hypothetical protein
MILANRPLALFPVWEMTVLSNVCNIISLSRQSKHIALGNAKQYNEFNSSDERHLPITIIVE